MYQFCYFALLLAMFQLGYMQGSHKKEKNFKIEIAQQVQRYFRQSNLPVNRWVSREDERS